MVDAMTETASTSVEGQSMHTLCEDIFGYIHQQPSTTLYKAPAAEGQTRGAASYFCRTLPSNPGNWKKSNKARLTSFNVCTPSIQCLVT